jgi:hypothetical protein
MGWVVNVTSRSLYTRDTDPIPMVQETWLVPGLETSEKFRLQRGFDPRTVKPLANDYPGPELHFKQLLNK